MEQTEVEKLVNLRMELIGQFNKLRDYKSNKNAIMLEKTHAQIIHSIIVKIDGIIEQYVNFEDN